jgi:IclR family transcriptional regulator, acetate operon repressor
MRPVEIALQLIELLGFHQPAGVTDLARLANLPKSTIQRNLLVLQKAGWIEMVDRERAQWTLTIRASLAAGGSVTDAHADLRNVAIPVMEEIRRSTKETVNLSYMFGSAMVLFERLDGISPVKHFARHGTVFGLYSSAAGRSILAKFPPATLEEFLANPVDTFRSQGATIPEDLRREIQKVKKAGYAFAKYVDGPAVAAAICDPLDRPFAAISLTAPAQRTTPALLKKWGPMMADGARRISIGAAALSRRLLP